MSDELILQEKEEISNFPGVARLSYEDAERKLPTVTQLETQLAESSKLVDDIILKKYLYKLSDLEVRPLDEEFKQISDIRLFKITEMVYQKDEYATYKFASVFNSVQNLNCGVFIVVHSDGERTDFYMGVRSLDSKRTTQSLKETLKNALIGQFPGVKSKDLLDEDAEKFLAELPSQNINISSVSCVANNKDEDFKDNKTFIQGLEKLALAMSGQKYTAIVLAKSTPPEQLDEIREAYETIYTQLSPFANMQLSYGKNTALSISDALSHGTTTGSSHTHTEGTSESESNSTSKTKTESESKQDMLGALAKTVGNVALGVASIATAPLSGGLSIAAAGALAVGQVSLGAYTPSTKSKGESNSETHTTTTSTNNSEADSTSESTSDNETRTRGISSGKNENMQLTMQNKTLLNTLERIDLQLKRLDECESLGMWECAAYFLSDTQETAEMAAGTYKALMKGSKSGVETSAINYWGQRYNKDKVVILRDYLVNFIHPVFQYRTERGDLPVTAASLLSSNELAIQMGLPRKSVCGFPVIEHADFGKEVVSYERSEKEESNRDIELGKIYTMGTETSTNVELKVESLTMHTFITGSTGSGKSNTAYEILSKLHDFYRIPFLVVEPAKGEYKNIFGQLPDVSVYGTNPLLNQLLRINPLSFPNQIHIYEHLDRLVEIFNVCWPMYAAMPAILKDAIERAYEKAGWDLRKSRNKYSDRLFPNFTDVLQQIDLVMEESQYSSDSMSDYKGALSTRVRSLTNGINSLVFCSDEIDAKKIFDESVIVDLSRVGSSETKSLIMGILVMKLQEYRMAEASEMNAPLRHVTVLEEAHNLLKRTSTEQTEEGSNLLGKSVEMLTNAIAEMRTYGEGFIIADQSPGLLDMAVIRNTNTKIIMRLPEYSDRELVGRAAGLNDEQITELARLSKGVAAVYQNDWIEPVLCKVNHYVPKPENSYEVQPDEAATKTEDIKGKIISRLLAKKFERLTTGMKREAILRANIPVSAKCALLEYDQTPDAKKKDAAAVVAYELFDAKSAFTAARKQKIGQEQEKRFIMEHLTPPLSPVPEEYTDVILQLLKEHYTRLA